VKGACRPILSDMARLSKDAVKTWLPVVVWLAFVFFMSTAAFSADNTFSVVETLLRLLCPWLGPRQIVSIHAVIRKGAHVFEYFVLGLLLVRAFRGSGASRGRKWLWPALAVSGIVLWALGDEFHQSFVATRTASLMDVAIDTAGGMLALVVEGAWHRLRQR
jgi:VanZ family protein